MVFSSTHVLTRSRLPFCARICNERLANLVCDPTAHSNIHGLWAGDPVAITNDPAQALVFGEGTSGSSEGGTPCRVSDYPSGAWPSVHADFVHRQAKWFTSDGSPYVESDGVKHTPYITVNSDGRTGRVFVGKEDGAHHPMIGVLGDEPPHWITEIYVVEEETGAIIAMSSLDPTNADNAAMTFDLPPGGPKKLTAYSWCNIHGLWVGPTVEVDSSKRKEVECSGETRIFTITLDCRFLAEGGEFRARVHPFLFSVAALLTVCVMRRFFT